MNRALCLLLLGAIGCGEPTRLQYDYGRAYSAAFNAQADLTRPSAADAAYPLSGFEGLEQRRLATESATDTESGELEAVQTVQVN